MLYTIVYWLLKHVVAGQLDFYRCSREREFINTRYLCNLFSKFYKFCVFFLFAYTSKKIWAKDDSYRRPIHDYNADDINRYIQRLRHELVCNRRDVPVHHSVPTFDRNLSLHPRLRDMRGCCGGIIFKHSDIPYHNFKYNS